jgi:hypothetical protein
MRILKLQAENLKRLKIVEITPAGDVVTIAGRNASGKSSALDAIWMALAGKEAIPGEPIRKGCDKARIKLDLGELLVERRFTASGGTTVHVTNAEGASYKSPQTILDALLGSLCFDPLEFSRQKPREQFDILRKLVDIPIDIDALTRANEDDYQRRKDINRQTKQLQAQADAISVPEGTPAEQIDECGLLDQIERAANFNADIQRRQANRDKASGEAEAGQHAADEIRTIEIPAIQKRAAGRVEDLANRIEDLRRQILAAERERDNEIAELAIRAERLIESADALSAKLAGAAPLPEPLSVSELRAGLDEARNINAGVDKRWHRDALLEQARQSEAASKSLTDAMEARENQKSDAIRAARMPVPGLGFGADHVTYNGVPFDQASSAERIRVSASIAMASNPKLRVIRIQDGSLLDEDGLRIIAEMAKDKDFQVWMECVKSDDPAAIWMEDGMVREVGAPPPVTAKASATESADA